MEINRTENEKEIVYVVTGAITDMPELVPKFFGRLASEVENCQKGIILDLGKVNFIDSVGIGLLIGILIKANEQRITIKLHNMQPLVRHTLDSTRIKKIFTDLY